MTAVSQSSEGGKPARRLTLRRVLRHLRRLALTTVVLGILCLLYLHHVGLPGFAKDAIVAQLKARGLELECDQLGLRWYRGILAEGVTLRRTGQPGSGEISLSQLTLRLNPAALLLLRLQLDSLEVKGGRLELPLSDPGEGRQTLTLSNVNALLEFPPRDCWWLKHLTADCLGVRVALQGTLTNALALRDWAETRPDGAPPLAWEASTRAFIRFMDRFQFERPPQLTAEFHGDARQLEAAHVVLRFGVDYSESPWGTLRDLSAALHLNEDSPVAGRGQFRFLLDTHDLHSPALRLGRLQLGAEWLQAFTNTVPEKLDATLRLEQLSSPWFTTGSLELAGQGQQLPGSPASLLVDFQSAGTNLTGGGGDSSTHSLNLQVAWNLDDILPQHGQWDLQVHTPRFSWGTADSLRLQGQFARRPAPPTLPLPPSWTLLGPFAIESQGRLEGFTRLETVIDRIDFTARWAPPYLSVQPLQANLFDRRLRAEATYNVNDRSLTSELAFDFNIRRLGPLLPAGIHHWLEDYGWTPDGPPVVQARIWAQLPPPGQDAAAPDARSLGDSLGLQGSVTATNAAFRGLPMETVGFDFQFTNQVWRLTDFTATAREGRFGMTYTEDQSSHDYRFDIDAQLDPQALRPLIPEEQQGAFDLFVFPHAPSVQGSIAGRWHTPGSTTFAGTVRSPHFVFRGEPIDDFFAHLAFTNDLVSATDVRFRSNGDLKAEGVGFDVTRQLLYLTNAQTTLAPERVARAIGPEVVQALSPYRFELPPRATANGWLDVRHTRNVDLRFEVEGGPFHYWRFHVPEIEASVTWSNQTVRVEDLKAAFYDGRLSGRVDVDLDVPHGADLNFESRFQDVDFAPLAVDVLQYTNRVEGRIYGNWMLTHANSEDWDSWDGFGQGELRDGHLWDLPVMGALSSLMVGMGVDAARNPVRGLAADFTLTNSLIHTRNLELRSAALRIEYRGTFDFAGGMNGRAEAQLLRDAVIFGPLVSLALSPIAKLLEFRVTGTIGAPVLEPVYIPKPLLFPFNPIGTIRNLFKSPEPD